MGIEPVTLRSKQRFVAPLANGSSGLHSSGWSQRPGTVALWLEHFEALAVAILHGRGSNPASLGYFHSNSTGPTARLTASCYRARLSLESFILQVGHSRTSLSLVGVAWLIQTRMSAAAAAAAWAAWGAGQACQYFNNNINSNLKIDEKPRRLNNTAARL